MSEQIQPQLVNGLTFAEATQLSLDFLAAPEAFAEARRFHGIYVDDVDDFRVQLTELIAQDSTQNQRHLIYRQIEASINALIPHTSVAAAALGAASAELEDKRHALAESKDRVFGYGREICVGFAAHMLSRLPGVASASLNGTTYEWGDGKLYDLDEGYYVMTRSKNTVGHTLLSVYGDSDLYQKVAHHYLVHNTQKVAKRKEIHPRMVEAKDWLAFVNNLSALTRF